jgi:hypothetical protein
MNAELETQWTATVNRITGASDRTAAEPPWWECAWHTEKWGHRAWFTEDHQPKRVAPTPAPLSSGMCAQCAKLYGITI